MKDRTLSLARLLIPFVAFAAVLTSFIGATILSKDVVLIPDDFGLKIYRNFGWPFKFVCISSEGKVVVFDWKSFCLDSLLLIFSIGGCLNIARRPFRLRKNFSISGILFWTSFIAVILVYLTTEIPQVSFDERMVDYGFPMSPATKIISIPVCFYLASLARLVVKKLIRMFESKKGLRNGDDGDGSN